MYKVSVTTLEKFRRYMKEVSPFDTEEALIASIKGTFLGNDKTKFGGAYHKIIEGDFKKEGKMIIADSVSFHMEQAKPALKYRFEHPVVSNEIPVEKVYSIATYHDILVKGKVDIIEGLQVRDAKCKFKYVDAREYTESCQWKLYLDMLEAGRFFYDVFEIKGFDGFTAPGMFNDYDRFDSDDNPVMCIDGEAQVIAHDPIECIAYPGMLEEIQSIIVDFFDYVESRNLFEYLRTSEQTESILD